MKEPPDDLPLFAWTPAGKAPTLTRECHRYPDIPGHKSDDDTTIDAAADMASRAETLRAAVLHLLRHGPPLSADQAAASLGESVLAIRPRFSELRTLGYISDSGARCINASGKRAIIWQPCRG